MRFLILFLSLFELSVVAFANPVIYQGGQMFDSAFDSKITDAEWMYSYTSQAAAGYRYLKFAEDTPLHMVQTNWLIKRWNEENSQANVYVMTGLGVQGTTLSPYLGAETDLESREYYASALAEHFWAQNSTNRIALRLGKAPYISEYEGLHTWLIVQFTQLNEGAQSSQTVLPIIRLFKDNVLAEFGSNGSAYEASLRIHF